MLKIRFSFIRPIPGTCSFFECRLNVSCKYDTLLMQINLNLVLRCTKNMKSPLRYYATFKVRKFELLFYKINTRLQKTTLDCGQNKYPLWIFNINKHIFHFWAVPFLCYFQKLQLLVIKKFWNNFCCFVILFLWAQKMCLRFLKILFQTGNINILSLMVSFLVDKKLKSF